MNKLFLFALALIVACPLPAADVQVDVYNFASGQVRNRRVTLTLVDPGPVTVGPWLIAGDSVSQMTGAQGSTVFSNVLAGQYRLDIAGAPGRSFPLGVPDTNALINAVALIGTTNSVPYFYTAQQIDELLAGFEGGSGGAATNVIDVAAGYGINVLSNALLRTVAIDSNTVHNAANLSHGKLPVQRLPDAVVYTNNPNVFTASNRFWFTTFTTNVYLDAGLYTVGGSGDVNLDGLLSLEDYVMLNNYFSGLTNLIIPQRINSDVNGDGTLNHHDLVMIGYMVSGYSRDEAEVFASSRFMLNPDGSRAILASGTVLHGSIAGATNASPTNLFGVGTLPVSRLATGTANATNFLRGDGSWQPLSGGGGLLAANNLNDVASLGASRTNLLAHHASNLTAGLLPDARLSTNVSLLGSSIATNEIDATFYNWVEAQTGIVNTNIVNDGEVVVVTNPEGFPFLRSFVSTSSDEFAVARPASLDITENHPQILFEANRLEMTDPAKQVWLDVITSRTLLRGGNQDALTLTSSNVTTHLPLQGYLGRGTNILGIAFDDITVTGEATNVIQVAAGYAISITTNALLRTIAVTSNTVHNAGNLTSGSLPDARLSANVPLKNSTNVFSSSNVFSQPLQLGVSGMGRLQLFDSANTTNYLIRSDEGFLRIDAPSVSLFGELSVSDNLYADTVTAGGASNYLANLYSDVFGADEAFFGDLTVGTFYTGITNAPVLGTGPDGELIVGSGGAVDWTGNADQFSVANGTTNIKSGALVTNLVLNGSTGYSTNGGASQLYITVSDDKLKLHGAHIGSGGVFYGNGSGLTNITAVTDATNSLNTALTTRITDATNSLNTALTTRITDATNSLNTALTTRITDATNHVNLSVLERNVVSTTNSWGNQVVTFGGDRMILTNMAGNLTLTGIAGFTTSNLNWMTYWLNPNGDTRTLTIPTEWYAFGYFTNETVAAITNNTRAKLTVEAVIGVFTNATLDIAK